MPVTYAYSVLLGMLCTVLLTVLSGCSASSAAQADGYQLHRNITATTFWVGETESADNGYISNVSSCWDDLWLDHYGGEDSPDARNGYLPAGFTPHENPFYVALPYTDFSDDGVRKANALRVIPWVGNQQWGPLDSLCKNQWVRITRGDKVVYAQWEDSGPFEYDDTAYVFGSARPQNTENEHAGIDLSPAVSDYLGLNGMGAINWQFVRAADVPDGPWKTIVTTSQITWISALDHRR